MLLVAVLVAIGLLLGGGLPAVTRRLGGDVPLLTWTPAVLLLTLASIVAVVAWSTWQAVHRRQQRVNSDRAVFLLALAQASARVGALFMGAYGGFALAYVEAFETSNGRDRVQHGAGAAVAAGVLLVSGLLLERACRLPTEDDPDDDASEASAA